MQNNNTFEPESFYIELEQFYISFCELKSLKSITIVNTLANNAFKSQITLNNETISPSIVSAPYVFNLSTDLQYNNIEFKKLLINLKALTKSTRGIG